MTIYKRRHKLLKILCEHHCNAELGNDEFIGVSDEDLLRKLNCNKSELFLIASELLEENEIANHDNMFRGYYSTQKGNASYTTKKYLNLYHNIIWSRTKNFVQTLIPILSLIIAILAITLKIKTENEKLEKRIQNLERKIEYKPVGKKN